MSKEALFILAVATVSRSNTSPSVRFGVDSRTLGGVCEAIDGSWTSLHTCKQEGNG